MKKKLRLKLSTVISRFQNCREKTSAASALPPVFFLSPPNPKRFDIEFPTPPPPPRPSPTRRLATAVISTAGCRSCVPVTSSRPARLLNLSPEVDLGEDDLSTARGTPAYLWRKEEKWHVVTCAEEVERRRRKIDCEEEEDDVEDELDLFTSIAARRKNEYQANFKCLIKPRRKREIEIRRRRRGGGRKSKPKSRNSTSSVASGSWFSSDDDEENDEREDDYDDGDDTDTLLSSRSFSTDTSAIKPRRQRRCTSPEQPRPSSAAASVLGRLVPCGANQGKVKESFAVVKKSEDPRGDFRRSMAEMVVEKAIYDAADLGQLLHCFLSLNSRRHHLAIVAAFADIWVALFPETSPHHVSSSSCKE